MYIPCRRAFTANLIIGASIALFVYYLKESSLLEILLAWLARASARAYLLVVANRLGYASSPLSLVGDAACVLGATILWTYLRSPAGRSAATFTLALLMLPVALWVYRGCGVILISPLMVLGMAAAMAAESVVDQISKRLHNRVLDRKHEAEFSILGHLNHSLKPNLQIAKSPLTAVLDFLEERGINQQVLSRRLDGSFETVGEALHKSVLSLDQIGGILENTRKLVTSQIRREDFGEVRLVQLLAREIAPLYRDRLSFEVTGDEQLTLRLHRESFVEAVNNLIRNALTHAFTGSEPEKVVSFSVRETRKNVIIDYSNNGRPFPPNLEARDFLACGRKSSDSPGEGLGGAWVGKVVEAHHGSFEVIRDELPLHFRITLPKRGI